MYVYIFILLIQFLVNTIFVIYILFFRNSKKIVTSSSNYKSSSFLTEESVSIDLNAATFLDVAVLRCLFIPQWCEEGVYWALQFLYHRYVNYYIVLVIVKNNRICTF